jgi:hypothetical protein
MGPSVDWPGRRVGGADGKLRFRLKSIPGPILCDLEPLGGGPGGGGGSGIPGPQRACELVGVSSTGVRDSVPRPRTPADAALREAGALLGDSELAAHR